MLLVPKRFVVGGTNDRERERSQVSEGMVERMPRAWSLLGRMRDVLCVELIRQKSVPSMGAPALPFIDQGGSRGYRWEKEENTKGIEGPSRESGLPFSLCLPYFNMADRVRGGVFADPRRPYPGPI